MGSVCFGGRRHEGCGEGTKPRPARRRPAQCSACKLQSPGPSPSARLFAPARLRTRLAHLAHLALDRLRQRGAPLLIKQVRQHPHALQRRRRRAVAAAAAAVGSPRDLQPHLDLEPRRLQISRRSRSLADLPAAAATCRAAGRRPGALEFPSEPEGGSHREVADRGGRRLRDQVHVAV